MKRSTVHRGNEGENKHADDAEAGEKVCVGRRFSDVKQGGSFDLNMFKCPYIWYVTGTHHDFSSHDCEWARKFGLFDKVSFESQ